MAHQASIPHLPLSDPSREPLRQQFMAVRQRTQAIAEPLSAEDQCVQSMPDASPVKWHLAHTSWFFETVVLQAHNAAYEVFDAKFAYLFNSYYEALGPRHARPQRGLLTRPPLDDVLAYRRHVDEAMAAFMAQADAATWQAALPMLHLGLNHEQQHQELILTDVLHAFASNPLLPTYRLPDGPGLHVAEAAPPMRWLQVRGGLTEVGHAGQGFAFDNETPRHTVFLQPFEIADRLVTCGEFAQFVADGGYRRPELWLSDGWATVQAHGWTAPSYWLAPGDGRAPADHWQVFGLRGVAALCDEVPVSQLSFYEAAAYAEWAGARLPTEFEWEAASTLPGMRQITGYAWQWTRSSYDPYPGFRPFTGAVAEYNGKFMVGQVVLRGGSQATPEGHTRPTYRNFFPPAARWQFSGLRLARDVVLR